jgi:hypothetical protein
MAPPTTPARRATRASLHRGTQPRRPVCGCGDLANRPAPRGATVRSIRRPNGRPMTNGVQPITRLAPSSAAKVRKFLLHRRGAVTPSVLHVQRHKPVGPTLQPFFDKAEPLGDQTLLMAAAAQGNVERTRTRTRTQGSTGRANSPVGSHRGRGGARGGVASEGWRRHRTARRPERLNRQ